MKPKRDTRVSQSFENVPKGDALLLTDMSYLSTSKGASDLMSKDVLVIPWNITRDSGRSNTCYHGSLKELSAIRLTIRFMYQPSKTLEVAAHVFRHFCLRFSSKSDHCVSRIRKTMNKTIYTTRLSASICTSFSQAREFCSNIAGRFSKKSPSSQFSVLGSYAFEGFILLAMTVTGCLQNAWLSLPL